MNMFSCSANLWRLLREHEPFNALYCYCVGFLSGLYGPKIGQNYVKYVFWHFFSIFPNAKVRNEYFFLVVFFSGDFWENISHLTYFVGSVRGFRVGHMVPKLAKIAWYMTFWALFEHFHFRRYWNESIFW